MASVFKVIALASALALGALTASAATVATGGTGSTGGASGSGAWVVPDGTEDSDNPAYNHDATSPASNWVWVNDPLVEYGTLDFVFTFDLTDYITSTAALTGVWAVDNYGTVDLNGTEISSLDFGYDAFVLLNAFDDTGATFNAGLNTLTFHASNMGGPGGFRASISVTAAPVPLPASLPLLAGALAAAAYAGSRRKRRA